MPFVNDLILHVHTPGGETKFQTQSDLKARQFAEEVVLPPLHLKGKWYIYDLENKRLDPNKTLGESGVGDGDHLYFRQEAPAAGPAPETTQPRPVQRGPVQALKRCENGHYYDPVKYKVCPQCERAGLIT